MKYEVQLSPEEMQRCKAAAEAAIINGKTHAKVDYTVGPKPRNKLIGAGGELALSILFGIPVKLLNFEGRDTGDVSYIESRATENPNYNLRVNMGDVEKDKLSRPFVFSRHKGKGLYEIVGWHFGLYVWTHGKEIDQSHTQADGTVISRPFRWIADEKLRPVDEVICIARGWPVEKSVRDRDALIKEIEGMKI